LSGDDLGKLVSQAREMQSRVAALQRDLAARRVEGSAGGGMVTAQVTGQLRVVEIRIEPQLVADGDRRMIEDLCAAAVNAALDAAQRMVQEEVQKLSGGLGGAALPGLGGDGD
jgi:DNA-binding YbaB/EbfC family protein